MTRLVLALSLLMACGGAPARPGSTKVDVDEWCETAMETYCGTLADACFDGLGGVEDGCLTSAVDGCVAGRDPAMPADRTLAELDTCVGTIENMDCAELGQATGQLTFAQGPLSVCALPTPEAARAE